MLYCLLLVTGTISPVCVTLVLICSSTPDLGIDWDLALLVWLCRNAAASRSPRAQAGSCSGCSSKAAEAGAEGDFQGNQKRARKSCWGKPDINSMLQRKSRSPGNPLWLLPLPHAPCCIPASCTPEGRSMSFSTPCLSSQRVPSHTSVSRLPAPCKLHSPRIPAALDTPLLPLSIRSTACGHTPGETTHRLMGVVLFSR